MAECEQRGLYDSYWWTCILTSHSVLELGKLMPVHVLIPDGLIGVMGSSYGAHGVEK
jgi:hypothetical protein